ncbi:SWIM zinc finger domain protein [Nitzschia inconspicua]|uniref:SWIM zinc finger domain protein n=1 Tax=Nitzschia inconspicua TaxID=303405 RepID=A0A9K3PIV7_9STRA|nr:SWIM zinc finger domain protein [Nitzschia inconspicua]
MVTALSTTSSLPEKRALLTQLEQKSPDAYKSVMDIDAKRWMDSAWLEDEKFPPSLGGESEEEALLKVRPVDCVCDCGKWQAIGVPCVHGMVYFRHQMKWSLEDVLDQPVDEYHKYRTQRELYRRNSVPVWRHLLEPDMMTLPPDVAARRMPGKPKTVRLRKNFRYAHEPEKSPTICSHCHQPSHNVKNVRKERGS